MLPHWHPPHPAFLQSFTPDQRRWLTNPGSLTRALRQRYPDFQVRVLRQGWQRPSPTEARQLGIPLGRWVWSRCVELWGQNRPQVYAETLIPRPTLQGRHRQLRYLGNRPLGAYLFGPARAKRATSQICRPGSGLPAGLTCGRRSVFLLPRPLLVAEYFFDSLFTEGTAL